MHRLQEQRQYVPPQPQPLRLPHILTTEERNRAILRNHLPAEAVEWVYGYLVCYKVHFHITQQRRSKLGDYRWPQPRHPFHEISINGDLNPYMFLWVFLHEAAHLETHAKHSVRVAPHGHEWQAEYALLLAQHADLFPPEAHEAIIRYASRIPLNRAAGRRVEEMLHRHDRDADHAAPPALHLDDLAAGSLFRLKSKPSMTFRAEEKRRTRWLCTETATGRRYTVSGAAEVEKIEQM